MSEDTKPLNGGVFVGARPPVWDLDHEQAWHRLAAYLFATGNTAKRVAVILQKSQPAVQNLLRQPWFQKMVTELMAQEGSKDIAKLFASQQYDSMCTLVEMRDDAEVPAAVRVSCAKDILDRAMGKPTQRVEMSHETVSDDPVAEVERLEQENRRLREELNSEGRSPAFEERSSESEARRE